jgi:hypothetical protein
MERPNLEEKLKEGMTFAKNGQFTQAEAIFDKVIAANHQHLEGLIWKAAVTNDPAVAVTCLEKVMRLDPHNQRAKHGLDWARKRLESSSQLRAVSPQSLQDFIYDEDSAVKEPVVPPPPVTPKTTTFSPSATPAVKNGNSSKQPLTSHTPVKPHNLETNPEAVPYKKSRLQPSQTIFTAVELPPEALKKPDAPEKDIRPPVPKVGLNWGAKKKSPEVPESAAFRAAQPKVQVKMSDHVAQSFGDDYALDERQTGWSLPPYLGWVCMGGAVLLALLTFLLSNLAPVLGVLAVILAISGAILFNQSGKS